MNVRRCIFFAATDCNLKKIIVVLLRTMYSFKNTLFVKYYRIYHIFLNVSTFKYTNMDLDVNIFTSIYYFYIYLCNILENILLMIRIIF